MTEAHRRRHRIGSAAVSLLDARQRPRTLSYWAPMWSQVNSSRNRARLARPMARSRTGSDSTAERVPRGRVDRGSRRCPDRPPNGCSVVVRDDRVACGHRLDQGRVGAADSVAVQVEGAVEAQGGQPLRIEDGAGKQDLRRGRVPNRAVVRIGLAVRTDHEQLHPPGPSRPGGDDLQDGVLRNRPAHEGGVATCFRPCSCTGQRGA